MDALISIVIPAYNSEAHIERAIRSAQNQTLEALEILVVDDGSEDRTRGVIERCAATDSRVKLFMHSENSGIIAARRTGTLRARGRYIGYLDADDELLPDACWTLARAMRKTDAQLIHFGAQYVPPEGGETPQTLDELFTREASGEGAWEGNRAGVELLDRFFVHKKLHWSIWSKFCEARLAKRVFSMLGNERCDMAEDALTTFLLLANARSVAYVGYPLYRYHVGVGITAETSPRKARAVAGEYRLYQLLRECLTVEQKENDDVRRALFALHDDLLDAVFWNFLHIKDAPVLGEFIMALSETCTPFAFSRELQRYHAREGARIEARVAAREAGKRRKLERHYLNDIETLRRELKRAEQQMEDEHRQWGENEAHYLRDIAGLKGEIERLLAQRGELEREIERILAQRDELERQVNMGLWAQVRERTKKRLSNQE